MPLEESGKAKYMEPVRHVGYHADLNRNTRNHRCSREAMEKIPTAIQTLKLHDKLRPEKPSRRSFADLHQERKPNIDDRPLFSRKSTCSPQRLSSEKKTIRGDEIVKHMSGLPCNLQNVERGGILHKKALNFGVADLRHLEKSKYNEKQVPCRSTKYPPSNVTTSSPFSTVRSSTVSGGSDGISLGHQKTKSPPVYFHPKSSSDAIHSQGVKTVRGTIVPRQQKLQGTDRTMNGSMIKLGRGDVNPKFIPERRTSSSSDDSEILSCSDGFARTPDNRYTPRKSFHEFTLPDQRCAGRQKTIVLLLPGSSTRSSCSTASQMSESTELQSIEGSPQSFSQSYLSNIIQSPELKFDTPHSGPLVYRVESSNQTSVNLLSTVITQGPKVASYHSQSPLSAETPTFQSIDKLSKKTESIIEQPTKIIVIEPCNGSRLKAAEAAVAKGRSASPKPRFSGGSGTMERSLSSKDHSPSPSSTYVTVKSSPVRSDSSADSSSRDKANANSRRSSPLRRLLDPLLKPKASIRRNSTDSLQHEPLSTSSICESTQIALDSSNCHQVKRSLNFSNCGPTNTGGSHQDEKHLTPMVQALLQITVRNGLPWFTFAVESSNDVLAATMKKVSVSGKYDCSWIYTFYSFHKIKKKSGGWMSQGGRAKSREYVPDVVGQMKVSGSQCSKLTVDDIKDQTMVREFVLLGIESRQAGEDPLQIESRNELAAIVVKVPKETVGNAEQQTNNRRGLSEMRFPECLLGEKSFCNAVQRIHSGSCIGTQNVSSAVVLLPSGVHGMPTTGFPSPLIDRWRSGGSCDCGGWDIGCRLTVLSNQEQQSEKFLRSPKACLPPDQCALFVQGRRHHDEGPLFKLTTYKKGIYSIDFNASISSLQAFSICIAFLHSRNLGELSEVGNLCEEITSHGALSMEPVSLKMHT